MGKKPEKSKRFKYNLQSVLKVREIREQQEKDKFAEAANRLSEEERKELELKKFQSQKYHELRDIMSGGQKNIDFQEIIMRKSHLDIVKEQVEEQIRRREEAEEAKEEQRKELAKAAIDKKIIEKDKEKKKVIWKKMMDKEEGKFLDEISSIQFARRQNESQ